MPFVTTKDGVEIFYKDWGPKDAQPIVFHHGWPLSSDDWDAQMLFFVQKGYRVVAHDRRGHGRSAQVSEGHDMDHYAADAFAVVEHSTCERRPHRPLDRRRRSRPLCRAAWRAGGPRRQGGARQRRAAADAEDRKPIRTACRSRCSTASARRSPPTARSSSSTSPPARSTASTARARRSHQGVIQNWWRQGMMGSAKAHYEGIKAFSETDQTEDLKAIDVPTLVLHGDDDQIVPIADAALKSVKLLKNGTLKSIRATRTAC